MGFPTPRAACLMSLLAYDRAAPGPVQGRPTQYQLPQFTQLRPVRGRTPVNTASQFTCLSGVVFLLPNMLLDVTLPPVYTDLSFSQTQQFHRNGPRTWTMMTSAVACRQPDYGITRTIVLPPYSWTLNPPIPSPSQSPVAATPVHTEIDLPRLILKLPNSSVRRGFWRTRLSDTVLRRYQRRTTSATKRSAGQLVAHRRKANLSSAGSAGT